MECPKMFTYWTPDQVAECVEGISDKAYADLWDKVRDVCPGPENGCCEWPEPDAHPEQNMPAIWHKLEDSTKEEVIAAAKRKK